MSELLFLCIGFVAGALIVWFWAQAQQNLALKLHESEIQQAANQERQAEESKLTDLRELLMAEKELRIRAQEKLNAANAQTHESEKYLIETFRNLANEAIDHNSSSFLRLANQVMEKQIQQAKSGFDQRSDALGLLIKPIHEAIAKQQEAVQKLATSNSQTFGSLSTYLQELNLSHKALQKETGSLVSALKSPKVRGRWGEIGLRRIVEFSGLTKYCHFDEQVNYRVEEGSKRPDMTIHLPGNKHIVVDSKAPLNAYLEAIENPDETQQQEALLRHSRAVATHMKDLGSKAYWAELGDSVDFVVLYIEVEPAFGAALAINPNLVADGIANRVVFATPTTLIAMLQTVAFTWKQHEAGENAMQIWRNAQELYERIAVFADHIRKMGGSLKQMVSSYNQAIGSWEGRVLPSIRKLEELGAKTEKKMVEDLEQLEINPRELKEE
jgi:DNA recombination protein RmuC